MNSNKFFALIALSVVFSDSRGMNKLPNIGEFGYQKTEMTLFLEEFKVDDTVPDVQQPIPIQAEVNITQPTAVPQSAPRIKRFSVIKKKRDYALNILDMLDAEKSRIISQGIGLRHVPGPKMVSWLKFLGFSFSSCKMERTRNLINFINENWSLIETRIEKQQHAWVDTVIVYKPTVQANLASFFEGKIFTESEAVKFYIKLGEFIREQGIMRPEIGSIRDARRSNARIWQEMYHHWGTIAHFIPAFLNSKNDSAVQW